MDNAKRDYGHVDRSCAGCGRPLARPEGKYADPVRDDSHDMVCARLARRKRAAAERGDPEIVPYVPVAEREGNRDH